MKKPSERIQELELGNMEWPNDVRPKIMAIIRYLDEEYEKKMNEPVSCSEVHPTTDIYHPGGHKRKEIND